MKNKKSSMHSFTEFWNQFGKEIKLTFVYIFDTKVPMHLKIVPFIGLIYVISPIDVVPDFLIGPGFLDDFGIILLCVKIFVNLVNKDKRKREVSESMSGKKHTKVMDEKVEEGEIIKE